MSELHRRHFLKDSATVAGSVAVTGLAASKAQAEQPTTQVDHKSSSFASKWESTNDRIWIGPEYWSNPLQDWRVQDGRVECVNAALERNLQLLTFDLNPENGSLKMSVIVGRVDGKLDAGRGSCGFRIGIEGPLKEYRNSLIYGKGLNAGCVAGGGLFIGDGLQKAASDKKSPLKSEAVKLELLVAPEEDKKSCSVTLSAYDPASGKELDSLTKSGIPADQLAGNIGLVANYSAGGNSGRGSNSPAGAGKFWFADWQASGTKLTPHPDRSFGPILFSHYTLSDGMLTITAQMPPIGKDDAQIVALAYPKEGSVEAKDILYADIDPDARTATFRIEDWDTTRDVKYVLFYPVTSPPTDNPTFTHSDYDYWTGTIRKDPVDQPVITVADISCNTHTAFPNHEYTEHVKKLNPDLMAFVGDQFYESSGGYGIVRKPVEPAIVDYLRKWYLHGWTWRELTKDRPSVSLPDDHDVYQGNIWGENGAPQTKTQEAGGYNMDPRWVNVVHRTQTSHHPAAYDPTPIRQDISVYYGPMTYGKISFAVLADRMFKTAPEGNVPPTGSRGDHVINPDFDPKTADLPGLELLGDRQMKFLGDWVKDWNGAEMKAIISQTIFSAMATTHGGNREVLRADYDANGWPQTARDEALRLIRKCFAVHIAGDQHLPAVIHYGIDEYGDAGVAFAGPAVNVGYPRWWEPKESGQNRKPGAPEITGDFLDHFGNKLTVLAVKNGEVKPRGPILEQLYDRASGLGIVRFNKPKREITFEAWPFLVDPQQADAQFPLWPVKIGMQENYGRKPAAYLPKLMIAGVEQPVVEVWDDAGEELIYTLRLAEPTFQPHVFAEGKYTVVVHDPETQKQKKLTGLTAQVDNTEKLSVTL